MAEQKTQEFKFPSELIDLPSLGKLYPEGSPLKEGKVEVKYMTAREEDILTSANLIKKGIVIDRLLDSLILTKGVKSSELLLGDKNAIMIAARILAYGKDYTVELRDPENGELIQHTFDLSQLPYKELDKKLKVTDNNFEVKLPTSNTKITVKLLTGNDETEIMEELKALEKVGTSREVTTRLKKCVTSVDGQTDQATINTFVENMLSRDSIFLREYLNDIAPDIVMSQEVEFPGGERREVSIPMDITFFWPSAKL
tara:strand:- start:2287 stop:3054 length:768 start_codon:yes stop_codon:yes gene_type:complete